MASTKVCTSCREEKLLRHFSERNQVSKKTGKKLHLSHCKRCKSEAEKHRKMVKRAYHKDSCPANGCKNMKMVSAPYCVKCKGQVSHGKKVNPKFLVRGLISDNSRLSSICNEA